MLEKVAGTRRSCWGLNRRIFKQMEKGENGSEGRYKRPGTLLMGKGTSLRGSGIAFPECGSGEPGGGGRENWPAPPRWADLGGFKSLVSRA